MAGPYTTELDNLRNVTAGDLNTDSLNVNGTVTTIPSGTQTVTGTVTANAGTNLNTSLLQLDSTGTKLNNAQGSTTSGETGPLVQGAVTTAAPSYTTAQTNPLSLTTTGNLRVDGSSVTQPVSGSISITGGSLNTAGKSSVTLVRNDYSSVNVTTAAYVQLVASLSDSVTALHIFDSSGQTLVLATGAAAAEVDQIYVVPGGNDLIPLAIAAGIRVSIKAVSATANTGELDISFLK